MAIWLKRAVFAGAALYILLSPALPQLAEWGTPWVRPWTMYSGVGEGLTKGVFTARYADGREEDLTALQVLGLQRYPDMFHYEFDRLVHNDETFEAFAADFCAREQGLTALSFEGQVGASDGWAAHQVDNLCAAPVTIAESAP